MEKKNFMHLKIRGGNSDYGRIGSLIPYSKYKVGDLVFFGNDRRDDRVGVICYNPTGSYSHPFIMGWGSHDVRTTSEYKIHGLVLPSHLLTDEILKYHESSLVLVEKEVSKLTVSELRDIVGFDFEIIVQEDQNNE